MTEKVLSTIAPTRARQKVSNRSKNTKWSPAEDELFSKLMADNPTTNWADLLPHFPGKTPQQIAERWDKVLNPTLVKGSWTKEEDETIIDFVSKHGTKNWTKLATLLPGRIGKQCRERWRNHLDPEVNRSPWTQEEDKILIDLHEKLGNQWVKIAESLPGRSDNCVKNRWNSTLKKQLMYENEGIPRPRRGRPANYKAIPKSADDVPKPPKFEEIATEIKSASPKIMSTNLASGPLSPFITLKSPFGLTSPVNKDFSLWSPAQGKDFDSGLSFSPNLFSPSLADNRAEIASLLSPMTSKKKDFQFDNVPPPPPPF